MCWMLEMLCWRCCEPCTTAACAPWRHLAVWSRHMMKASATDDACRATWATQAFRGDARQAAGASCHAMPHGPHADIARQLGKGCPAAKAAPQSSRAMCRRRSSCHMCVWCRRRSSKCCTLLLVCSSTPNKAYPLSPSVQSS
jgi:hypothetical protein